MKNRKIKTYSDRGSLKDVVNLQTEDYKLTPFEIRLKKLYDYSEEKRDNSLQESLGFINLQSGESPANPVSISRLKEKVNQIESKSNGNIDRIYKELSECFIENNMSLKKIANTLYFYKNKSRQAIYDSECLVKTAEYSPPKRGFRKAI